MTVSFLPGLVYDPVTFSLTVNPNGTVKYTARPGYGLEERLEDHRIVSHTTISKDIADRVLQSLDERDFFSLKESYESYAPTDMPYFAIEVMKSSGQSKKVKVYGGHVDDEADLRRFYALYNEILGLSGIKRWLSSTFPDKASAEALKD